MQKSWSPEHIKAAVDELKKHSSLGAALPGISKAVGFPVSKDSLRGAFQRAGQASAGSFLQPKHEPPVHPVEAKIKREKEAQLRTEHSRMAEELQVANERADFYLRLSKSTTPPHIPRREKTSGLRDCTAVALASDWHVEEEVDPEMVAGRNEYNLEIAEQRIERFFNAIAWNIEHQRASGNLAVRDLILWLGGDLMSGYIHEELMEGNLLSPVETCLWLQPRIRGGIKMLLDKLDLARLVIPCSYGNHGRTTPRRRVTTGAQNSYEWGMYHNLASHFEDDKRVQFEITRAGHQYVTAYDFKLHFHHGDDVNFQGGVGGIGIPLNKAIDAWNDDIRCDIHNIGHWHQLLTVRSGGNVNGSLIGWNAYAKSIKARYEDPKQAFYLVDSGRGQTMFTPLWVGERKRKKAGR